MALNYTQRLANVAARKFDRELNESVLSKSAAAALFPENVKYLLEAMRPIDGKYNERTLEAATRIQKHLEDAFSLHFERDYRTQGSVRTGTNIRVHSDFDLLGIIKRYYYQEAPVTNAYTESDPDSDIQEFRKQATNILKGIYDEVDDSGDKSIAIRNKSLNRKVDVVFCFWYWSNKYAETRNDHYKAVYLYNFPSKSKQLDYPFATINSVNWKGDETKDGSRRGIRLLKTLKADAEEDWKTLKSFHLTSLVHSMANERLLYLPGRELDITKSISSEVGNLINDPERRKAIKSPNGLEQPFNNGDTIPDLKKLKADLDELINDTQRELATSRLLQESVAHY
jgi:hypothetical protein